MKRQLIQRHCLRPPVVTNLLPDVQGTHAQHTKMSIALPRLMLVGGGTVKQIPSMLGRMGVNNPFIVTDKFLEASLRFVPAVDAAVPRVVCLAPQLDHRPLAFNRATALSAKLRRRWRRAPCRIAPFLIRFLIPQRRPPTASVLTIGSCFACLPTDCDNARRPGLSPFSAGSDPVSPSARTRWTR